MGIKVKSKIFLKDLPKDISKNFSRDLKNDIADIIVREILEGKSPVRSKRFEPYADVRYKGRLKPVDMLKEGKMLESLRVKQNKIGQVEIVFNDKKANWHQKGKGKLPVRELLPARRGSQFNVKITNFINKTANKAVKKAVRKQNN